MAVGIESATESHAGTTGSASEAFFDWSVPFTASSRGLLVFTFLTNATGDDALSVKIDPAGANTDVPAVSGGRAVDTLVEPGDCKAWFLGSGLPTTTTTVRVNRTNNANVMYAVATVQTAGANCEVYTPGIVLLQEDQALTEQSVNDGSPGVNSQRFAGCYYGGSSPPATGANSTSNAGAAIDLGVRGAKVVWETTPGQGARLVGFTDVLDDVAAVHLAVREASSGVTGTIAVSQENQTAALSGSVANPITGTIGVTQANQIANFSGTVTNPFVPPVPGSDTNRMGGSGAIRKPPRSR